MKIISGLLFLLFVHTWKTVLPQTPPPNLSTQVVKEDLDYLYNALQETHYNLFAFQSKQAYDSMFAKLKWSITTDSLTLLETISCYQRLVSFANTGHSEIDFPAQSYISYAYNNGTVFPLELAFESGKVFIRKNYSGNSELEVGDQLLAIDEQPINQILQQLYPLVSAEREYLKLAKIEFWSFPRLLYQLNGKKDSWKIKIHHSNEILNLEVGAIPVLEYEGSRNGEILDPQKELKLYGASAYLNPGQFGSHTDDGEKLYRNFIDSSFTVMKEKKIKTLIIDLRNHPGGHNAYSDYLISYFASKPFKWYSSFSIKTSEILKQHTRQQADTADAYSKAILKNSNGQIFKYEFPACDPVDPSKRFKGKVLVLVNRQTYSMAAVSAALIKDYRFGEIVGEETGDAASLYASQFSFLLPKTNVTVKVPKGYMARVNGRKETEGVKPDTYIQDHLLDDKDEVLERLLKDN